MKELCFPPSRQMTEPSIPEIKYKEFECLEEIKNSPLRVLSIELGWLIVVSESVPSPIVNATYK